MKRKNGEKKPRELKILLIKPKIRSESSNSSKMNQLKQPLLTAPSPKKAKTMQIKIWF